MTEREEFLLMLENVKPKLLQSEDLPALKKVLEGRIFKLLKKDVIFSIKAASGSQQQIERLKFLILDNELAEEIYSCM